MSTSSTSASPAQADSQPLSTLLKSPTPTEPVDFEFAPEARRRYLVAVDREVLSRVQRLARTRGVSIESLVNLLLEQRLLEVENQT